MAVKRMVLNENGNLMVMVLMIFLVLSVLGTAIISAASMENKISHYAVNAQQARQAADAGAEWAIEQIWQQNMPDIFEEQLKVGDAIDSKIKVTNRENLVSDPGNGTHLIKSECRYQFTVESEYNGAKQELAVEVVYLYSGTNPHHYDQVKIAAYKYN